MASRARRHEEHRRVVPNSAQEEDDEDEEANLRNQLRSIPDVGVPPPPPTSPRTFSSPFNNIVGVGLPMGNGDDDDDNAPKPAGEDITETGVSFDAYVADAQVTEFKMATAVAEPVTREQAGSGSKRTVMMVGGCIVVVVAVVIVIVVVVVAVGGGSDDGGNNNNNNKGPSLPLVPDETDSGACFKTTKTLANALRNRKDDAVFAEFSLCASTTLAVDDVVDFAQPHNNDQPPLLAQSNLLVKCGEKGSFTDKCIVSSAMARNAYEAELKSTLVLNSPNTASKGAFNVTFEGITFEHGWPSLMEMRNFGDVTFRNCIFRQSVSWFLPATAHYFCRK